MKKIEENGNIWKKTKKKLKIYKILPFLDKFNPFKQTQVNDETGKVLDSNKIIKYRELTVWLLNIHLNGLIIAYILNIFMGQPFMYAVIVADGLTAWIIYKLAKDFKEGVIEIVNRH